MAKDKILTSIEVFTKIANKELTDQDAIRILCEDHEDNIYFIYNDGHEYYDDNGRLTVSSLAFEEYTYQIVSKETAKKEEKAKQLASSKADLERRLKTIEEDIASLEASNG